MNSGYELVTARQLRTTVSPSSALAATAPAIAMRWSPWLSSSAPAGRPPRTDEVVGAALHPDAEALEQIADGADAVALLDPQLGGVAELGDAVGERRRHRQRGDLVDHPRDLGALDRRAVQRRGGDPQLADRLAEALAGVGHLDGRAHAQQHVDERDAGRVERDVLDHQLRTGGDGRGHHPERGRRRVAGHVELDRARRAGGDAAPCARRPGSPARRARASIRSVWSRLAAGSVISVVPVGLQPGEDERGLHLRAGDRERVRRAHEVTAADDERRERAVGAAVEVRAHGAQRLRRPGPSGAAPANRRR